VIAMLAALRHRRRTGKGQRIELSQVESVVNTLGTAVVERLANGSNPSRMGNRRPNAAPHGAFRAADDPASVDSPDRWVAIACATDAHWRALCDVLGHAGTADDLRFATFGARKQNEDALEDLVASWTRDQKGESLVSALQDVGVPAGLVQNAQDLLERDEHMQARSYYQYLDHPEAGRSAHDGTAFKLSNTPGYIAGPAPLLGEHTMDVCERIIGLTPDEIAELLIDGVLR
jgi:benzylsuccinate CoA-transferase BbsF subunit